MNAIVAAHDEFELQHRVLISDIRKGLLVPVLGGDINLCGRPVHDGKLDKWVQINGQSYPPSTSELAAHLLDQANNNKQLDRYIKSEVFEYLVTQLRQPHDCMSGVCFASVSEYVKFVDKNILEGLLPDLLSAEYRPTPVHEFLVKLAQYKPDQASTHSRPFPCIVTACLDQVLEQHFRNNKVPFHLVAFARSTNGGVFRYTPPESKPETSSYEIKPQDFSRLMESFKDHAVVIKLNGGIGTRNIAITEDHYIDYLSHFEIKNCLPEILWAKLTSQGRSDENSHLLFLGFSLRHWNHRVLLRRFWSENLNNQNKRWTVVMEQDFCHIDRKFWNAYGLQEDLAEITSLNEYIEALTARLSSLPESAEGLPPPPNETAEPARKTLFVSYSHKDERWSQEIIRMLSPISSRLGVWFDGMITPGTEWSQEIKEKLASAKAALLLVSNAFLNSEFIQKNELPELLKAAKSNGCKILWIKIDECLVEYTEIGKYQALYNKPLISLTVESEINKAVFEIANKMADLLLEKPVET